MILLFTVLGIVLLFLIYLGIRNEYTCAIRIQWANIVGQVRLGLINKNITDYSKYPDFEEMMTGIAEYSDIFIKPKYLLKFGMDNLVGDREMYDLVRSLEEKA